MEIKRDGKWFQLDFPGVTLLEKTAAKMLDDADDMEDEVAELLAGAAKVAHPKILCAALPIEEKCEDYVVVEGIRFPSALLRKNLDAAEAVFAYVGTCGQELEQWSKTCDSDFLIQYWTDRIKEAYLQQCVKEFFQYLREEVGLGDGFTRMNPGSLEAWPISEQEKLFACMGADKIREEIGVSLTPTMLMMPSKSVSGFAFSGDGKFESCQYCPRRNCPSRLAPSLVI